MKIANLIRLRWLVLPLAFVLLNFTHQALDAQSVPSRYYYYQGTQIRLTVDPHLVAVSFGALAPDTQRRIADATGDVENFQPQAQPPIGGLVFVPLRTGREPLAAVARFTGQGVPFASPVYDFGSAQLAETPEFLVRFKSALSATEIVRFNQQNNVSIVSSQPNSDRVLVLQPNAGNPRSARELANLYFEQGVAAFAEPNFVMRQARPEIVTPQAPEAGNVTPNDTSFGLQWALKNTRQFQGSVAGADIDVTKAWGVTKGASSLKIAILDVGIDASIPDLAGKVLPGYNATNGSSNTTPQANDYHGTAVAGTAAANSNNNTGIAGVCWFCQILPVKIGETDSTSGGLITTTAILAGGIDWAWQHGADVLSNSWVMFAPSDDVQLSIINARFSGRGGKGSTVVFAAGNDNAPTVAFPASLNSYVIAVGASNWCDQRWSKTNNPCNFNETTNGSNYGSALDLVAPGIAIYTTCTGSACTNGSYIYLNGTSLSTPLVSGVVGLLYSLNPNLTPDKVQQILQSSAQDLGTAGRDNDTGYGRLDAYRAITYLYNLSLSASGAGTFVRPGDVVNYTLSYANKGSTAMGSTTLNVTLPANTTYVSSTPAFTAQGGNQYALNLGTLPSNTAGSASFRVQVQPAAAGQKVILNASIGGAFPEFDPSDNTATVTSLGSASQIYLPFILNKRTE